MNDPIQVLCQLHERYGKRLTDNAQFCTAILGDHKQAFKRREVDALAASVQLGIPQRLQANVAASPWPAQRRETAQRLHHEFGLDKRLGEWCAEAWGVALGLIPGQGATAAVGDGTIDLDLATPSMSVRQVPAIQPSVVPSTGAPVVVPAPPMAASLAGPRRHARAWIVPALIGMGVVVGYRLAAAPTPATVASAAPATAEARPLPEDAGRAPAPRPSTTTESAPVSGAAGPGSPASLAGAPAAVPDKSGAITDLAGILRTGAEQDQLLARLTALERQGLRTRILTVRSTQGEPIDSFGRRVANAWNASDPADRMEVLVTVATEDRQARIDVSRDALARLPDEAAGRIAVEQFAPAVRSEGFGAALRRLLNEVDRKLAAAKVAALPVAGSAREQESTVLSMLKIVAAWDAKSPDLDPARQAELDSIVASIDAWPKPARGDRKLARQQHAAGMALLEQPGWAEAAAERMRQAHATDPLDVQILNDMAYAEMKAGHHKAAADALMRTLQLAPKRTSAWVNLAETLAAAPEPEGPMRLRDLLLAGYLFSGDRSKTIEFLRAKSAGADVPPRLRQEAAGVLASVEAFHVATQESALGRIVR